MASPNPSNSYVGNREDAMIDAPTSSGDDQEINKVDTEDEYAFLYDDSQIPRPQGRGSDEESFQPSEPDEVIDMDRHGELPQDWQPALIKPESEPEDTGTPIRRVTASPSWTPVKRRAGGLDWPDDRPFKRAKGAAFSREYLNLLNVDIEDAAAQYVPHDESELPASQIGLTYWTSVEKELFFTALSRLGRDDAPGIARRIRTKGELEVRQYLRLLQDATTARKCEYELEPLYPQDFPAAVEIGPQCAAALDEAGDAIASRQERHEQQAEEMRWDDDWLITPFNYRAMEKTAPPNMPSLGLFRVSRWLELSERLFMNANYPENNWQYVSNENPSIRTTALEDFYSLVVSLTKRLVAATIYVSDARVRARPEDPRIKQKGLVWPKDVEAAVLSLGLKTNSKDFWAKSARRLRVNVINDGEQSEHYREDGNGDRMQDSGDNDDRHEFMTFDEVEVALGSAKNTRHSGEEDDEEDDLNSLSDTPSLDDLSEVDDQTANTTPNPGHGENREETPIDVNEEAVHAETKELLLYTATPYPLTTRTRRMVESRIRSELRHITYADTVDAKAREREEKRLWNLLGEAQPEEGDKVKVPERAPRRMMHTVDEMRPFSGGNWRDNISYVSEWAQNLPRRKDGSAG